jgi:peptidoglycan/LPS O-acetylase OafA/YrhL
MHGKDDAHSPTGQHYYQLQLDVLRFVAFAMVFTSHTVPNDDTFYTELNIPPGVSGVIVALGASGAFGVDLFFALSAFLEARRSRQWWRRRRI